MNPKNPAPRRSSRAGFRGRGHFRGRGFAARAVLVSLLLAAAAVVVVTWDRPHPATAEPAGPGATKTDAAEPLEVEAYARVMKLRGELSLTNADLAAMGLSQEQAEAVLASLITWCEQNKVQLQRAEADARKAQRELRETMRKINVGPRDEAVLNRLPQREAAFERAASAYRTLRRAGGHAATGSLSSGQRQVWQAALSNADASGLAGLPGGYRYVAGLSEQEVEAVRLSKLKRRTPTPAPGNAPGSAFAAAVESAPGVSYSLRRAADAATARQRQHLVGVINAEARVLPVPEALIENFEIADAAGTTEP